MTLYYTWLSRTRTPNLPRGYCLPGVTGKLERLRVWPLVLRHRGPVEVGAGDLAEVPPADVVQLILY